MARVLSTEKFLNSLAERTIDNTRMIRRDINQRRNGMEDLYGVAFTEFGDAENPASFYISISPDMVYLERFAFKFVIEPYQTTVTGGTDSATVTVDNRTLNIEGTGTSAEINPNPHNHGTRPHTHNLITGKSFIHTTSKNWRVKIAGIDITDYLQEQVADIENGWLGDKGEGVYPDTRLDSDDDLIHFYDILDVASVLYALDTDESRRQAERLLRPEMKKVEILSDAPFGIQAYLYLKLSHVNR